MLTEQRGVATLKGEVAKQKNLLRRIQVGQEASLKAAISRRSTILWVKRISCGEGL